MDLLYFFLSRVSQAFASVNCCLVITCWERADTLTLVGDVLCMFVSIPCGFLSQVWYLIVSIPDLCLLSYFHRFAELGLSYAKTSKCVSNTTDNRF